MSGLPQGWLAASLGDFTEIVYGKDISVNQLLESGFPVFGANGIIGYHSNYLYEEEQVLISCRGAYSGKINWSPPKCFVTHNSLVLKLISDSISKRFLYYALQAIDKSEIVTGSAQPQVTISNAINLQVPLPPLNEQRRIEAKLDELLSRVDACQQRLARIPVILKRFRQAVLAAACSGRLTADWREKNVSYPPEQTTIESIAEYVGGFAYKSPTFLSEGTNQVIRIGNVKPFKLKLDASPAYIPNDIAEQTQRFKLQHDDIVISMTGTKYKQDYGFAAIVLEADGNLYLNQRVGRLRCSKKVLPVFLMYFMQSEDFRTFFFAGETGNVNQGNVGADGIRKAPIELPPLPEQQEIVRRVETLFKLTDQLEARYTAAQAQVDKLTQSILAKAFRGELVPQDPNDEPAEKLLERIREQREAATQPRKKKASPGPVVQHTPTAEPPAATLPDLSKTARKILRHMKKSHTYAKHELTTAAILSTSEWSSAIRELKEAGLVLQTGDKRGASYSKP